MTKYCLYHVQENKFFPTESAGKAVDNWVWVDKFDGHVSDTFTMDVDENKISATATINGGLEDFLDLMMWTFGRVVWAVPLREPRFAYLDHVPIFEEAMNLEDFRNSFTVSDSISIKTFSTPSSLSPSISVTVIRNVWG